MFSEVGLKEPPPPAIDMLAVLVGTQAGVGDGLGLGDGLVPGDGLGLGDGLVPGDGLGLGDGLVPGDGLGLGDALGLGEGLGLGLCASATLAPTLRKITPRATTARWTQCDCFRCRVRGARLDCVAWS
jgi:hypothetical protein